MSKCINNVPGHNRTIRAPRMQYDIDRALKEAELKKKHPSSGQPQSEFEIIKAKIAKNVARLSKSR